MQDFYYLCGKKHFMEKLIITNFRCFERLDLTLTPGVNLLIGDNASGKTSLLLACKYAINSFFSGYSDIYTKWVSPHIGDFMRKVDGEKRLNTQPISINFSFSHDELPGYEESVGNAGMQSIVCKNEKKPRPLLSGLKEIRGYGKYLISNSLVQNAHNRIEQKLALPLFASYSTHGIHKAQPVVSKYFNEAAQSPSFGYYLCNSTDGLLPHWIRRMLILTEAGFNPVERGVVLDALTTMFGDSGCDVMTRFDVRVNYKDIVCVFKDGRQTPSAILSDGYRRLFSIVTDLAFRCALLNGLIYGSEAARLTRGTVIIDEIDLHLHPSLQAVVVKALQRTFPLIQFILSTHAPIIMSGVEHNGRNCVLYMAYNEHEGYSVSPIDTFGMDISTLTETVLQVPSRDPSVKKELDILSQYVDEERYDEAKVLLSEMKEKFGDKIPELNGIDTRITIEEAFQ